MEDLQNLAVWGPAWLSQGAHRLSDLALPKTLAAHGPQVETARAGCPTLRGRVKNPTGMD